MMKKIILLLMISFLGLQSCVIKKTNRNTRTHKVVLIKKAPRNHKVVVIKSKRYYTWGGKHYRKTKKGFIVVRI